ncbi:unnamed protein product [Acidocella sp. C78]|uniref:bifunctional diguanylate cyclase/phosphodiesterase n=1 Tax=Acidocella sp. C78 TaxID=1671486 RepID=UPI00191BC6B4|nr:EAL domain-containing protein [Acidocella sp. C78]CAG4900241.1 unnamed protein product [Acidocella sp. C78]
MTAQDAAQQPTLCQVLAGARGFAAWEIDPLAGRVRPLAGGAPGPDSNQPAAESLAAFLAGIDTDDRARVAAALDAAAAPGSMGLDIAFRRAGAAPGAFWQLARFHVVGRDEAGRPLRLAGIIADIGALPDLAAGALGSTENDRLAALAAELARRTEELASAHRLARVGAWRWDLARHRVWLSTETLWLLGIEGAAAEMDYDQLRRIIHPDDYHYAMACFREAVQTATPVTLEYRTVLPDGAIHAVLTHAEPVIGADGRVAQLRGTTQDVTPFRRVEAALRESEDHYRHMVELHPQIPWTAGPDGGILEVGPQWLAITGMTREETMPFGWTSAVHPDDLPPTLAAWQHSLASGDPVDVEFRIRAADGAYAWVRARAAARRDEAGQILRWYGTLEDITDRWMAENARKASEALALRVLEASGDAVIVFDAAGAVTFANARLAPLLGLDAPPEGLDADGLFASAHCRELCAALKRAMETGAGAHFELFWPPTDRWLEATIVAEASDISLFLRDVSEKRLAQQQLRYAASVDYMTGAANRASLFSRLAEQLQCQQPGNLTALLCLDLDYFKEINDQHGHPTGDAVLRQLVSRLRLCLRSRDLLARCGGDEFVIMQTGVSAPPDALALADRILAALRQPFEVDGISLPAGASIGVAVALPGQADADSLYRQADRALYVAKSRARGTYRLFHPDMLQADEASRRLRAELSGALGRGEFALDFQPIVHLATRRTVGVEALLRWHHPARGLIPPAEFIPLAEESGQIAALGAWVLRRACAAARAWPDDVKISVNVSPRQFEIGDIRATVTEALAAGGLPASRLKLEITESVLLSQNAASARLLQDLRELGAMLVLDDFGTGFSSLSYLDTFKVDVVKIDKSFLSRIRAPGDRQPIFEAIMGMTAALNLPVTAEGVETAVQLDYVTSLGCDWAQGYFFSPPVSEAELRRQLRTPAAAARNG